MTVLTGSNGTGKTTLLTILGRHFGWNINFVSTPFGSEKSRRRILSDVRRIRDAELSMPDGETVVGNIQYDDGNNCTITSPNSPDVQYDLHYGNRMEVVGLHIPSHRPVATYQPVTEIPTDPKTVEQQYVEFQQLLFQTYSSARTRNPGIAQKQSIISLAVFGYGSEIVMPNPEYREILDGFQQVLRQLLPQEIGFQRLEIRLPEVVLVTESGTWSLDAMSGGINALFGIAWQIHMFGANKDTCTVIIDEPENHLHPSMQRSVLPNLARAFPNFKFIISTPFVVSFYPDSSIYGLVFGVGNGVVAQKLESRHLSGTPNRVLREILDVPSNLPIWVEQRVKDLMRETSQHSPQDRAARLLELLGELGISDALSDIDLDELHDA